MKKTILALTAAGTVLVVGGFAVSNAYAQEAGTQHDNMIAILAEKLGISQEKVSTAFEESRTEVHEQMSAQREEDLKQALADGDLTQRQYTIADTMHEIREENFDASTPRRGGFNGDMVDLLNEKGLDVTETELEELRTVMQDLNLVGGMGKGMGRGQGMGMHR